MKRLLITLLALMLLMLSAAQADTLVVYFSCTGNTERVAAAAAEALAADLWQIVPEEPYSDTDLNYSNSSCRANTEQNDAECRPAIAESMDVTAYDTILVGYPIWWGEEPRIIDTWLESVDLTGKKMATFCTSGSSGIQTAYAHLQEEAPAAEWLGARRFSASVSPADMTDWCASIGLE